VGGISYKNLGLYTFILCVRLKLNLKKDPVDWSFRTLQNLLEQVDAQTFGTQLSPPGPQIIHLVVSISGKVTISRHLLEPKRGKQCMISAILQRPLYKVQRNQLQLFAMPHSGTKCEWYAKYAVMSSDTQNRDVWFVIWKGLV